MISLPRSYDPPRALGSSTALSSSTPNEAPATWAEDRGRSLLALNSLLSSAYRELLALARAQMRRERPGHLLESSALVHEAFLRLAEHGPPPWESLTHFFATAAQVMRQVLVDYARREHAGKRGGGLPTVSLADPDFIEPARRREAILEALDDTLRLLGQLDTRQARVVEMRFFAGMNFHEIGHALGLSAVTVRRDWSAAKAWLHQEMSRTARG
jgi:RNA polymerase sigma-70 factor (ECF subfamily)